jgi:hypothetical protein
VAKLLRRSAAEIRTALSVSPLLRTGINYQGALLGYDDNRVDPYVQNYSLEIQREIATNLTLEARYIGSKGTHLYGGISINDQTFTKTAF